MSEGTLTGLVIDGLGVLKPGLAFESAIRLAGAEKFRVGKYVRGSLKAQWG